MEKLVERERLEVMLTFSNTLPKNWRKSVTSDLSAVSYSSNICLNTINLKFDKRTESDEEIHNGLDIFRI